MTSQAVFNQGVKSLTESGIGIIQRGNKARYFNDDKTESGVLGYAFGHTTQGHPLVSLWVSSTRLHLT
jgi:hypothetical protein